MVRSSRSRRVSLMSLDPARAEERTALYWGREKMRCEDSFTHLADHYLRLKSKQVIGFPTLKLNRVQQFLHEQVEAQWKREGWVRQVWGKTRQVGACLDPDTRVLTVDMGWKCIADVEVGDALVSVEESPGAGRGMWRKFRPAIVQAVCWTLQPTYRLTLSDGRTLMASGGHRFFSRCDIGDTNTRQAWRSVEEIRGRCQRGYALRAVTSSPWPEGGYEDGWVAGVIDGEGSSWYAQKGMTLTISQVAGPVWERLEQYMKSHGYNYGVGIAKPTALSRLPLYRMSLCRSPEVFRLIGQTRPSRLFCGSSWWDGKSIPRTAPWLSIMAIEAVDVRRLVDIQTTTGTFIAEGVISHNSTYGRARSFHQTAFKNHRNAFLAAHDEESVYELFEIDKTFYASLPDPLKPAINGNSKTRLAFSGRNSKVLVGHAKNINVGASQMNHIVHLTEVARYGPNADDVQGSLFPSISDAKGDDHSMVIVESTSHYGGVWFKEFAEAAMRGENGYEFHFVPAYWHEGYAVPVPRGFRLDEEEKFIKRKYNVTDGFLAWRRLERGKYGTNPALFVQDFPLSWEESWSLPKGTMRVFTEDVLGSLDQQLRPGQRMFPESTGLKESLGGPVEVWEKPVDGVYYDLGCDVAEGRTDDANWTAITILRRDTLAQVAGARFHMDPASPEFLDLVYWLGCVFNTAQINIDITGGWGMALLSGLQRRSYPNLWQWRRRDDARERVSQRVGFLYTRRDKRYLVDNTLMLAKRGGLVVHSQNLVDEARNFLNIGLDEWGAAPGETDDEVTSWMLALLAARDEQSDDLPVLEPRREPTEVVNDATHHDTESDLLEVEREQSALRLSPWTVE